MFVPIALVVVASASPAPCEKLRPSADRHASDAYAFASCLVTRTSPPPDYAIVRRYFQRALSGGYKSAACPLGDMMMAGLGGPSSPAAGLAGCREAAEAGDAESEAQFGGRALQGSGMPRDPVLGRTMLIAAAKQGHALAALRVGMIYWNGDGTSKDNSAAREWWQQAYRGGRKEAAVLLGDEAFVRLSSGVATPDKADPAILEEAVTWYRLTLADDPRPSAQEAARQRLQLLDQMRSIVGKPLPPR